MLDPIGIIMSILGEIMEAAKGVFSLVSKRKERREAILSDMNNLESVFNECGFIDNVDQINEKYDEWRKDFFTPRKVQKLLPELLEGIQKYSEWLTESRDVIDMKIELTLQKGRFKALSDRFANFNVGHFKDIKDTDVKKNILMGTIDLTQCKEDLLQYYGRDRKTLDGADSLRKFVDSGDFFDFVEILKKIQEGPSVDEFRKAGERNLEIMNQINEVLKK